MNEQRSKKRMTKLLAMLLAFFMVLAFALPNNSGMSFADSNNADEASLESGKDGETLFGEGLTRTQILEEGGG